MNEATGVYKFASVGELSETVTQMLSLGLQYRTTVGGSNGSRQQSGLEQMVKSQQHGIAYGQVVARQLTGCC